MYVPKQTPLTVLDVGSRQVAGQTANHRSLFDPDLTKYVGVDVADGPNVDIVLEEPYRIPTGDDSFDVVVCGQVFEHIPFFWATAMELTRVVKNDGFIILSAPSRGHVHSPPFDGWRFYEDGYRAIAEFCDLRFIEASTDFPPINPKSKRFDYSGIASDRYTDQYWGDTVGIFQKTALHHGPEIATVRETLLEWCNARAEGRVPLASAKSTGPDPAESKSDQRQPQRSVARRIAGRGRRGVRRIRRRLAKLIAD